MAVTFSGKDKQLFYTRFYLGGYDISGDARTFSSIDWSYGTPDMTGVSDQIQNFLAGRSTTRVTGFQALANDTATSGAYTLMKAGNTAYGLIIAMGGGGEPEIGDPAYHLPGVQMSNPQGWDNGAAVMTADFLPYSPDVDTNYIRPFGVLLHPQATALTATVNPTSSNSIDNGAATAAGWSAMLQILVSSGGTWVFNIAHSADDSSYANLGSFSADGSAITTEFISGTGTVNQYVAFNPVRSSGTCTVVCSFARN